MTRRRVGRWEDVKNSKKILVIGSTCCLQWCGIEFFQFLYDC